MNMNIKCDEKDFVKSPMNYTGSKYKSLPKLFTVFPEISDIFVDLFGGGFNVGVNAVANKIVYNDSLEQLVNLFKIMYNSSAESMLNYIDNVIEANSLGKYNNEEYLAFRDNYNSSDYKNPLDLYILSVFSISNQIRFNNEGGFNTPFGQRCFDSNVRSGFSRFVDVLHDKDILFLNEDFKNINFMGLTEDSFVYCDPPCLLSIATCNESGGWGEDDERALLRRLSELDRSGVKFGLSEVLEHKGQKNSLLIDWVVDNGFSVYSVDSNYVNCNYQKRNRNSLTLEILVTNY